MFAPMVDQGLARRLVAAFAAFAVMASLVGLARPAEADDTPLVDAPPINLTLNGVATQSSPIRGPSAGHGPGPVDPGVAERLAKFIWVGRDPMHRVSLDREPCRIP